MSNHTQYAYAGQGPKRWPGFVRQLIQAARSLERPRTAIIALAGYYIHTRRETAEFATRLLLTINAEEFGRAVNEGWIRSHVTRISKNKSIIERFKSDASLVGSVDDVRRVVEQTQWRLNDDA